MYVCEQASRRAGRHVRLCGRMYVHLYVYVYGTHTWVLLSTCSNMCSKFETRRLRSVHSVLNLSPADLLEEVSQGSG